MIPGYHTAGLLLHDICVAVDELAHIGYGCVAIRPHAGSLNPELPGFGQQILRLADAISRAQVRSVLDIDATFLHDPYTARGPSLVSIDDLQCETARRWIEQWIRLAGEIGSQWITFSSGTADPSGIDPEEQLLERLSAQLAPLVESANRHGVGLALRPRSGDVIATVAQFERLGQWLHDTDGLGLAADIGEMLIGGELPLADRLARNLDALACIYLCDRRAGHLGDQRIGHGDVAMTRILQSLANHQFAGPAIVRVEGHCELGFTPAREAIQIFDAR